MAFTYPLNHLALLFSAWTEIETSQGKTKVAAFVLWSMRKQETAHLEAAFIVSEEFNKASLKEVLSTHKLQHKEKNHILDHHYTTFQMQSKTLPRSPFGKSDHCFILLLPAYRQKLKQEMPIIRTIHHWSDHSDAVLQDWKTATRIMTWTGWVCRCSLHLIGERQIEDVCEHTAWFKISPVVPVPKNPKVTCLASGCFNSHGEQMFWESGKGHYLIHPGPPTVCLLSEQVHWWCNIPDTGLSHLGNRDLCKNTVSGL